MYNIIISEADLHLLKGSIKATISQFELQASKGNKVEICEDFIDQLNGLLKSVNCQTNNQKRG